MSVPEQWIDDEGYYCEMCDAPVYHQRLCRDCRLDVIDLYADAKIQDEKKGGGG